MASPAVVPGGEQGDPMGAASQLIGGSSLGTLALMTTTLILALTIFIKRISIEKPAPGVREIWNLGYYLIVGNRGKD